MTRNINPSFNQFLFIFLIFSRIFEILPQRISQWQAAPCIAEDNNKAELEKIRQGMLDTRKSIMELDQKHVDLDKLLETVKQTPLSEKDVSAFIEI